MSEIAMIGGEPLAAGVSWFLDTFMTPAVDMTKNYAIKKKTEFEWRIAADRYREKLIELYGTLRVLGASRDVPLDKLYTDVNILDDLTANRHYKIQEIQKLGHEEFFRRERERERRNGIALVKQGKNLYILGKPGAGKTTFLRYITIQAARYQAINRIPIFISLNEWARHGDMEEMNLLDFMAYQFDICNFPDARLFVEHLLIAGKAMVLFDALDEVKQEQDQRLLMTGLIQSFARKYNKSQYLITCRIAADEYVFQGFSNVEIADFTEDQVRIYAEHWFGSATDKFKLFLQDLEKPEHKGVRELCNRPLLLSLICLAFDDNMRLGDSRVEIYENAVEALLRRWDASRSIQRDVVIYGKLRVQAKLQILAEMAAKSFALGEYFIRQRDLEQILSDRLATLPGLSQQNSIDGYSVLKEIEAQHGLFVERAAGIYSFSHLTLQEFFTALFIKENQQIEQLMTYLTDNRWREVFILTASLLANADVFFVEMKVAMKQLISNDSNLIRLLTWAEQRAFAVDPENKRNYVLCLAYVYFAFVSATKSGANSKHSLLGDFDNLLNRERIAMLVSDDFRFADVIRNRMLSSVFVLMQLLDITTPLFASHETIKIFPIAVAIDYGIYYAWFVAKILSERELTRNNVRIYGARCVYPQLIEEIITLAGHEKMFDLVKKLSIKKIPPLRSNISKWRKIEEDLYLLMKDRGLIFESKLQSKQLNILKSWFAANELLVQCLNVAVVSDRQAILAGLLAPPRLEGRETG